MRKLFIIAFISLALTASASTITPIPEQSFVKNVLATIWRCKLSWHCYRSETLGSTITTINATDLIKDSRSVINTNFSNLNTDKLQAGNSADTLSVQTLTVSSLTATSTSASSTFRWGFNVYGTALALGATSTTTLSSLGTSTFPFGINITGGGGLASTQGLTITSSGTSSFSGGISLASIASTNGLTITGGGILNTSTASSTFSGGISTAGLASSQGLTITGNSITDTSTATSTFSGGISVATGGFATSGGLTITGGAITNSASASSTFTGGISTGGLSSSGGLTITGNSITNTASATSTFTGGISAGTGGLALSGGAITSSAAATSSFAGGIQITGTGNVCLPDGSCIAPSTGGTINWNEVASTTRASTGALNATSSPVGQELEIIIAVTGTDGATGMTAAIRFNNDNGLNYGHTYQADAAAVTTENAIGQIKLHEVNSTQPWTAHIHCPNSLGTRKVCTYNLVRASATAANAPVNVNGSFVWNNTTAQISTVNVLAGQGGADGTAFLSGSRLTIYGTLK